MVKVDKRPRWLASPMVWVMLLAWVVVLSVVMGVVWQGLPGQPLSPAASQPAAHAEAVRPVPARVPLQEAAQPDVDNPGAQAALQPLSGEQLASDLAAQYSQPDQALLQRHQGRSFRLLGRVLEQQVSGAGVSVVLMEAGPGLPPMRMVMAQGASQALPVGQAATLACVHGGMVMGEPLLRDCRVERMLKP